MSEQIIENIEMSMENVPESQVVQNAEQGPATSQDTVQDPSSTLNLLIDRQLPMISFVIVDRKG